MDRHLWIGAFALQFAKAEATTADCLPILICGLDHIKMSSDGDTNPPPNDTSLPESEQGGEIGPPAQEAGGVAEGDTTGPLEALQAVEDASAALSVCRLEPQPSSESVESGASSSGAAAAATGGGALFADQVCPLLCCCCLVTVELPQSPSIRTNMQRNTWLPQEDAEQAAVPALLPADTGAAPLQLAAALRSQQVTAADEQEDDVSQHPRHVFVFSTAGKPIYSYRGDESRLAGLMATAEAILSVAHSKGHTLKHVKWVAAVVVGGRVGGWAGGSFPPTT